MKVFSRVLFFIFIMVSRAPYADEVERLYETEVSVASELEQDREAATQQALQIILGRILAGKNVLKQEAVKNILANARYYVREFQYSFAESDASAKRSMRVLFDEKLLVDTLRSEKVGLWNEIRPRTLVWLVVEEQDQQQFFDPELMPEVDLALAKATSTKKIPVLYPMQDLNEKRKLSISDVLSAYSDHLLAVSTRYDVVSTLAGKMINKGVCWKAVWTFYFDEKINQWSSQCGTINEVALNGIQGVYDKLSIYYAVTPEVKEISSILLKVGNINSMMWRERVTDYLESLSMVKTVTWLSEEFGYDVYRIFFQGNRETLNHRLIKDYVLRIEDFSKQDEEEVKYKLIIE